MAAGRRVAWTHSGTEGIPAYRSDRPPSSPGRLKSADLNVVLQPIVDLRNGRRFAVEALVRCKWPEYANPIALFTQASAEKSCGRVGRIIRDVAFARCPGERAFVNVHPDELTSRWLVRPDDPLYYHDADVYIEVTESAAFTHFDLCMGVLKEVCARSGAHLVVDDLGAAYSNLKRVIELEPAIVKLDRALVTGIDTNRRQRKLVHHLVTMMTDLGAKVVAEGIETHDELRAVQDCGARYGQGFLLARPGYPIPEVAWDPAWTRRAARRSSRSIRAAAGRTGRPPKRSQT